MQPFTELQSQVTYRISSGQRQVIPREGNILTFNKDLISAAQRKYKGMIILNGEGVNTVNTVGGKKGGNGPIIHEGVSDKDNVSERDNTAFSPPVAFTAFTPSQSLSDKHDKLTEKKGYDYDDYKRDYTL